MKLDVVSFGSFFEMTDAQLDGIYGGQLGAGVGAGESSSLAASERIHSFAVFCDRNIFSTNARVNEGEIFAGLDFLSRVSLIDIGNSVEQVCASND